VKVPAPRRAPEASRPAGRQQTVKRGCLWPPGLLEQIPRDEKASLTSSPDFEDHRTRMPNACRNIATRQAETDVSAGQRCVAPRARVALRRRKSRALDRVASQRRSDRYRGTSGSSPDLVRSAGRTRRLRSSPVRLRKTLRTDIPILAGQPLWLAAPVGSRFGMYPAIEIDLHLIVFVQLRGGARPRLRPRFGPSRTGRTCSPIDTSWGREPAVGEVIAGTADESIGDEGEAGPPRPAVAELGDDDHRRPARSAGARPQQITDFAPSRRQIRIRDHV
jgi:hypothetical protein